MSTRFRTGLKLRLRSLLATATVCVLILAPMAIFASVSFTWDHSDEGMAQIAEGAAASVLAVLSLLLIFRIIRGPGPIRRRRWLPYSVENSFRELLEASWFGAGSGARWAPKLMRKPLTSLTRPAPIEQVRHLARTSGVAVVSNQSTRQTSTSAAPVGHQNLRSGHYRTHTVERGETWWALAVALWSDGSRWKDLCHMNDGLEVAPDVVFTKSQSLQPGWTIRLPVIEKEK